jgi:hypothetical protein
MIESACTEERFLRDIASHEMTIIRDEGVSRHIRFRRPDSINMYFDLITWPGSLCYTGDMGTFVFSRLDDMFEFFRVEPSYKLRDGNTLFVNPGYWGEKLQSISRFGGFREYSEERFKKRVKDHFDSYWEDSENEEEKLECWQEIKEDVLICADEEHRAYQAAYDFSHGEFIFQDFFDGGGTEAYTFHFLWCCYALAWGVKVYDASKEIDSDS